VDLDRILPWRWRRYAVALALVAAAAAMRAWPLQSLGSKLAYLTHYPVVMIAAVYGGLSAGLLATAAACLVVIFAGPLLVGQPFIAAPADWLGLAVFVLTCSMISAVAEAMRRANTRARLAQEQAEAANQAKSAFLANMSHELRTPLNAILGFSAILRDDPAIPQEQRGTLDVINRSGEHLLTLINDVLDMAKVEAGGVVAESEAFDLARLVLDVVDMMRLRAEEKGLRLTLDQSSEFPRVIRGDAAKVRQVLLNLVGNAVKCTEEGGISVRLSAVEAGQQGGPMLAIEVEDTGVGIAEADFEAIFEPFVQRATGSMRKGTGLGLAITKEFVRAMGGSVAVESVLGQGSVFRVRLPLEKAEPSELRTMAAERGRVLGLAAGQTTRRVLIVEDQIENWTLLKTLLESAGLTVRVAENGRLGVDAFAEWGPDLIFMDVRMPVMDGMEATRAIRGLERGGQVKIIALTASVFGEQRELVMASGMDDFVRKPYRAREVLGCVEHELGVEFEYEEPAVTVTPEALRPGALLTLPRDLRAELADAVVSLDSDRIGRALEHVIGHDPELGEALSAHAAGLGYSGILRMLRQEGE
jgi:signal transduction histidine kinase/CheY-like chemotaxis protein